MSEKSQKSKIEALKKKIEQQLQDEFGVDGLSGPIGVPLSGEIQDALSKASQQAKNSSKDLTAMKSGVEQIQDALNASKEKFKEKYGKVPPSEDAGSSQVDLTAMKKALGSIKPPDLSGLKFDPEAIKKPWSNPETDMLAEIIKAKKALEDAHYDAAAAEVLKSGSITISQDGLTIGDFTLKSDGTPNVGDFESIPLAADAPVVAPVPTPQEVLNSLKAAKKKFKDGNYQYYSYPNTEVKFYDIDGKPVSAASGSVTVQSGSFTPLDEYGIPKSEPVSFKIKGGGSFGSGSNKVAADASLPSAAEQQLIALAGATGVAKYVHASINADWDPEDHPRDPNTGEFVKGPVGYIFGKAKKASFKGIKTTAGLKDLEFDLKPGDVAFQTPGKNIVVSHANGDYTLYNAATGKDSVIPVGSKDTLAEWAQNGLLKKVAENPGTIVKAGDKATAAKMIEAPEKFTSEGKMKGAKVPAYKPKGPDPVLLDQINEVKGGSITEPPALKPGKTKYTAKQVTQFQAENDGKVLDVDPNGQTITSGSWVDYNGTPYQVFASPYDPENSFTAYKWVKTKQQAANEAKEDPFGLGELVVTVIPDPTGKPYLGVGVEAAKPKAKEVTLGTGSLMSQADTVVEVPNASVAHAKHLAESLGKPLNPDGSTGTEGPDLTDVGGISLESGDWVEIGGKPYQVHSSPNAGNIALKKWVATKKQAATTSYDFPAGVLVANKAVLIPDPTGAAYEPLGQDNVDAYIDAYIDDAGLPAGTVKDEAFPEPVSVPAEEQVEESPAPTPEPAPVPAPEPKTPAEPVTATGSFTLGGKTYFKLSNGSWSDGPGNNGTYNSVIPGLLPNDIETQWENFQDLQSQINEMQVGDTLHATSKAGGQKSSYAVESDGLVHASPSGQTASLEKLISVVANEWGHFDFSMEKKAAPTSPAIEQVTADLLAGPDQKTTALDHIASSQPGDSLEWGYESFTPDIYTKQPDGIWEMVDTGQAEQYGSEYEPTQISQSDLLAQLETSGNDAKYLTFTKKAASIEEDDTETTVAAPAPENVFVDAASGTTISLNPGDKVFLNTDTEGMYAVEKADGGTTVYNGSGLVFPTFMDMATYTDWEEADTWPGKVGGKKTIQPDPWAVAASGSPDMVSEDVSDLLKSFDPSKAKAGDVLTLSGGAGSDEIYTFNGGGLWTMSTASSPDYDEAWTSKELDDLLDDLVDGIAVSYASPTALTDSDHPFSSADGEEAAQAPEVTVLKDFDTAWGVLPVAAEGDTLTVHYADGHVEPLFKQDNGHWNPVEDVDITNGYSDAYLAGIIDNDTYLTLTTNSKPVTMTATKQPEPDVSDPVPAGTSLKGLLTEDGKATPALLDAEIAIGADNIDLVPPGTKIHYNIGTVYYKQDNGAWQSSGGTLQHPSSTLIHGVSKGNTQPNYDFSGVNVVTEQPKPEPVVKANTAVINTAMPGDKVQITVGGSTLTYVKDNGPNWTTLSGVGVTATSLKALAFSADKASFIYAGNDHTAPSKPSWVKGEPANPSLPEGITEGVGATKPGATKKPQQTSTSKAKAAQTNQVTLPDGTTYTLKPGEAFGFIEDFTGGGDSKPNVSVLVTAAGANKVWNAEGSQISLSPWWGPDKALIKLTPTSLKTAINKYGGELHGSNTYKKAKTDASSYGTFDDATNMHIESLVDSSLPTSNVWAWESHNNPFNGVRTSLVNMIHAGVASVQQNYAVPGQDGYKGIVPLSYYGIDSYKPFYPDPSTGELQSWADLDPMTKVSVVAKIAPLAAGYHNLIDAAYTPAKITAWGNTFDADDVKKYKSRLTANKNALLGLVRLGELAEALNDSDSTKTGGWTIDSLEAELGVVQKWANGPKHGMKDFDAGKIPVEEFVNILSAAFQKRKFTEGLPGLDFDPLNGTTEDYDAYAKSKGFEHLSLLTLQEQKTWVLADLGDPSISQHAKNQVANSLAKAKQKVALATLSASLKADQVKNGINPHADVPSAPEEGTSPYNVTSLKQGLKKNYVWKFKGAHSGLTHLGDDDWLMEVEGSESIHVNDAMVSSAIKAIESSIAFGTDTYTDFKESQFPAYAGVSVADKIKAKFAEHGLDAEDLLDAEGSIVTSWNDYANENKDALVAASVAEGSPLDMEFMETLPVAGLTYLAVKGSGDKVWDYLFQKQWSGGAPPFDHPGDPDTPEGKAALTALANKVASLPGGEIYLEDNANGAQKAKIATALGLPAILAAQWSTNFPGHLLAQYKSPDLEQVTSESLAPGETNATQPSGVSDLTWDLVLDLTPDTDVSDLVGPTLAGYTEGQLESLLTQYSSAVFAGVPKPFKQLALWGFTSGTSDSSITERYEFASAIVARVQAGDFLTSDTAVWTHPDTGAKFPVSPGAVVFKIDAGYGSTGYVVSGPPDKDGKPTSGFYFPEDSPNSTQKKTGTTFTNYLNHPSTQVLFTVPDPVTFEKAKAAKGSGLGSELTEPIWFKAEQIEQGKASVPTYGSDAVLTAAMKSSDYLKANYPALWAKKKSLPEPVKNAIVMVLQGYSVEGIGGISSAGLAKGTKHPLLDLLEYKAGQGHYASMGSAGLFDSSQPWNAYLSKGMTSPADVGHWSKTATDAYVDHFGLKGISQISPHLTAILHPEAPVVETGVSWKNLPDFNSLNLTNTGKNPGGMHSKSVWVDTNGDEWMSKAFNSDPNAKARVDAETNANKIGALFGFGNPVAETVSLTNSGKISGAGTGQGSGTYTYFQHMKPATGSFSGKSPSDLSTKQLQQAMSHHVLDWIVSNHDTHSENLLLGKDGNVFGIDLGQAFKFFPNDQLAVGYLPPGNGAPVWYDQFYKGIKNGSIDQQTADDVVKHVLRTAQRVAKTNDAEYKALLTDALKNRENFPPQYPTMEKFIDALMERKHSTLDDFVDLYKGIYASSPLEWDIDPENLTPPKIGDAHVSVTSDLTKSVMKAKATGQALMVNSLDLEDSYLMLQPQKDKNGSHLLLGEAKIRKDGDKKLVTWLKSQTVVDNTGVYGYDSGSEYGNSVTYTGPSSTEPVYAALFANNELFSAMVNYSKTVSSHNKAGDQNYNANTLSIAATAKTGIDSMLKSLEFWEKTNPGIPYAGKPTGYFADYKVHMFTMEQHSAFKTMLETYQGYYDTVKAKEGSDQKVTPHFTQVTYSPSNEVKSAYLEAKGLPADIKSAAPGTSITWKDGSTTYTATKVGKGTSYWTLSTQVGKAEPTTQDVAALVISQVLLSEPSVESTDKSAIKPIEEVEESATVKVGTKVLKVSLKNAAYPKATFDHDTGEQNRLGGEATGGYQNSGQMFEVDFGNVKITYRPWDPTYGVYSSQQGLLKFEKSDWDGNDSSAPASVNEILDVLRQMGLDLDAADETSLETFYWAHMAGVLDDRKDGNNAKWGKVNKHLKAGLNDSLSPTERLEVYREAWAKAIGAERVEQVTSSGWWKPRLSHTSLHAIDADDIEDGQVKDDAEGSGRPYWFRPDLTMEELYAKVGDEGPSSNLTYGGNWGDAALIATSGGSLSSEERARYFGHQAKAGASSGSDAAKGSSGFVFMRSKSSDQHQGGQVYYHPRVYLRTTNYGFNSDNYGDTSLRKEESTWDPAHSFNHSTEYMTKGSVSVLSDYAILTFQSEDERQAAIKTYKAKGITMINGIPIEEFFHTGKVSQATYKSIITRLWKKAIEDEKQTQEAFA